MMASALQRKEHYCGPGWTSMYCQNLSEFARRTLPFDTAIALSCASLHVPGKRGEHNAFIIATAHAKRMAQVARNVDDFKATGVFVINPWTQNDDTSS
jgi:predicted nucleic acid-binding protein